MRRGDKFILQSRKEENGLFDLQSTYELRQGIACTNSLLDQRNPEKMETSICKDLRLFDLVACDCFLDET